MLLMEESVLNFEEKKQHNLGLPTFKLPISTKNLWRLKPFTTIFDDFSIWILGPSSVVYILHKGII